MDRYQKDISEDRWGHREQRSYVGMPRKRERGRKREKEEEHRSE